MRNRIPAALLGVLLLVPLCAAKEGNILSFGGAPTFTYHLVNFAVLNPVAESLGVPHFTRGAIGEGGCGFFTVGRHVRLGGVGGGVSVSSMATVDVDSAQHEVRTLDMDLDYGAAWLEYVVPVGNFAFCFGATLGGGDADLTLTRQSGIAPDWSDLWHPETGNSRRNWNAGYFMWRPSVAVEWGITSFFTVRLQGSYQGARVSSGAWREWGQKITGAPTLDFSGFAVTVSPVFGF